jgi:hypothetical protein
MQHTCHRMKGTYTFQAVRAVPPSEQNSLPSCHWKRCAILFLLRQHVAMWHRWNFFSLSSTQNSRWTCKISILPPLFIEILTFILIHLIFHFCSWPFYKKKNSILSFNLNLWYTIFFNLFFVLILILTLLIVLLLNWFFFSIPFVNEKSTSVTKNTLHVLIWHIKKG